MTDRETIKIYDARASDYAELVDTGAPDKRLVDFIELLPQGAQVLDLGCGPGNAARHMSTAGCRVQAWDASSEMVALAAKHEGVDTAQKVFADLATLPDRSLDGVWANFSLLHAPRDEARQHITQIARATRPGGLFLFAAKTGTGEERDKIGRLYTYFTEEELRGWLAEDGYEVLRADHGREPGLSGEEADWFSLTSRKI